jgi:hypothetical protein
MKNTLSIIISKENFGFLFNRKIHDEVGTMQERLHLIKSGEEICNGDDN